MRASALLASCVVAACSHASPSTPPPAQPTAVAPTLFVDHVSGAGRPVIFVGDLGAPAQVWDTTLAHLGGRVEAHVLDIAGFAGNPAGKLPLLPHLGQELAQHIRNVKLTRPILVGHLFGADVAWQVAMDEPDLLGGVLVVDAPPSRGTGDPEETRESQTMRDALATAPPERFAQMTTRRFASSMVDQALAQQLAAAAARSDPAVVADTFHRMLTTDKRARIARVRAPVLLLLTTGNLPPQAVTEVEGAFREQLKPVTTHELVRVDGSRHYIMFDAPDVFFANLDRFLAAH